MITQFKFIKNLAVFKDFKWNDSIKNDKGEVVDLKKINILYGRNYSGKTTLSRIMRFLETKDLSDKYESPEFTLSSSAFGDISIDNIDDFKDDVRVFNEDFVRHNLKFIHDPNAQIEPFAIIGEDNGKIEKQITQIQETLGSKNEESETLMYKDLKSLRIKKDAAIKELGDAEKGLNDQLSDKATGRQNGIKYNVERFGQQSYDIRFLHKDIETVTKESYKPLANHETKEIESLIGEKIKSSIPSLKQYKLILNEHSQNTKELVEREIFQSDKIKELAENALLNKWANEGRNLHEKGGNCTFCGNEISESRWNRLESHFDETVLQLGEDIDKQIDKIKEEIRLLQKGVEFNETLFYSSFRSELESITNDFALHSSTYKDSLTSLFKQLNDRKDDLLKPKVFKSPVNNSGEFSKVWVDYESLRLKSIEFSQELEIKQASGKERLRYNEVYNFIKTIKYKEQEENITKLRENKTKAETNHITLSKDIEDFENQIDSLRKELNDEEMGAQNVNHYLTNFFRHESLELKSIEESTTEGKSVKFQITRNGKVAHHLSEGECSLIAFCYFVAKLKDIHTEGKSPIIWIDDPISSLDSNHIFFIYSLINGVIAKSDNYKQLFISTHNLEFLKFLKRLPGADYDYRRRENKIKVRFLLVQREGNISTLRLMPNYMREYVTEFNYLFEQIVECADIEIVTDSNHKSVYNFGNNARKFLEIYLYYKYPDNSDNKLERFFGEGNIPSLLVDRINNEYSHLSGGFERGASPIEIPEMKKAAELIIQKVKEDPDQYEALMSSIGKAEVTNENPIAS